MDFHAASVSVRFCGHSMLTRFAGASESCLLSLWPEESGFRASGIKTAGPRITAIIRMSSTREVSTEGNGAKPDS